MNQKKEFFRKLRRLITVLEHPHLFMMRRKSGLSPDLYIKLNHPWLTQAGINTIIDIGAHTGKWSRTIHYLLPEAIIYSFEPIVESYNLLEKRMRGIANHKGFNIGLGNEKGKATFFLNDFSAASSFRKTLKAQAQSFPGTKNSKDIEVEVERLDDVLSVKDFKSELMIKVDVQGFEDKVIDGGLEIFSTAKILIIELSFTSLYEGQPLFDDISLRLKEMGFCYKGNLDQIISPVTGEILQADAIFQKDML